MNLELRVLRPAKLTMVDCEIIGAMHTQSGPCKTEFYDELIEQSYELEDDELQTFNDYKNSIYQCFGPNLKAETLLSIDIPCDEEIDIDDDNLPAITMRPLCQRFADQHYSCQKFYWTGQEFKDFFLDIISQMVENKIDDDDAIEQIAQSIFPYLHQENVFVRFSFK
jgi:hypothetical protein